MNLLPHFPTVQKLPPEGNGCIFPAARGEEKEDLHHMNDSLPSLFPGEVPPGAKPPLQTPARCQSIAVLLQEPPSHPGSSCGDAEGRRGIPARSFTGTPSRKMAQGGEAVSSNPPL